MEGWSAPSLRRSASQASISAPSSSTIRRLVARVPVQGSGRASRASSSRPPAPNRSATGTGWPNVMSVAWIRFFNAVRWWTRWSRKRARSRSARTVGSGQPDLGHEGTPGELGQDPGVDLVGLGGQRGDALDLGRVGDRDIPAVELERVVDEAGPGHRLDRAVHLVAEAQDVGGQRPQRVGIRTERPSPRRSGRPRRGRAHRASCATGPIRRTTSLGPPGAGCFDNPTLSPARPLFMTFHGRARSAVIAAMASLAWLGLPTWSAPGISTSRLL